MLSIKNLTKIYRLKGGNITRALDGVSLEFPEKGMIFLLGKSELLSIANFEIEEITNNTLNTFDYILCLAQSNTHLVM